MTLRLDTRSYDRKAETIGGALLLTALLVGCGTTSTGVSDGSASTPEGAVREWIATTSPKRACGLMTGSARTQDLAQAGLSPDGRCDKIEVRSAKSAQVPLSILSVTKDSSQTRLVQYARRAPHGSTNSCFAIRVRRLRAHWRIASARMSCSEGASVAAARGLPPDRQRFSVQYLRTTRARPLQQSATRQPPTGSVIR